ncbi:MAG: hypothetical protein OSJ43_12000 [Oscillospiraceae bacterium]|nr:hypothetical protein [Oscillospiraceae bacterium]
MIRAVLSAADFASGRPTERVCEEDGTVIGMISFGKTDETDFPNAFEIWGCMSPKTHRAGE